VAPAFDDGLLPEDVMHLSAERKLRRLLKCQPNEDVPAAAVLHYQVVLNRHYCVIRKVPAPSTEEPRAMVDEVGTLIVRSSGATLEFDDGTTIRLSPDGWLSRVKELGFVLQPLITRAGAAWSPGVDSEVGCLVPTGARESARARDVSADVYVGNFDFIRKRYTVLISPEEHRLLDQRSTVEGLLSPGTVLWVVPDSPTWLALRQRFPPRTRAEEDKRVIKARLNVPTELVPEEGKLYVAIALRAVGGRVIMEDPYMVRKVDPWELVREGRDGYDEVLEYIFA
jgi:hypothetical protein